jgi:hypothetical protein
LNRSSIRLPWLILLALAGLSWGQVTLMGGKGQLRLFDAENVFPGHLYVNGVYSLFLEKNDSRSLATDGGLETQSVLVKDNTFNLSLTLGLSKPFELFINTIPYQDNQKDLWGPVGDTRCGLKFHIPNEGAVLQTGMVGYVQIPTSPRHPIPYESFTFDSFGWALLGVMNLDLKNSGSALPFKLSLNIGYRDNDWQDRYFTDIKDQLLMGAGFKFPLRSYQFYSEVTGELFVNSAQTTLRQNPIRFSQGIRFVGYKNFIFDLAADFRLGGYRPTENEINGNMLLKRYADWKVLLGVSYRTTLFTVLTPDEKKARTLQSEEKRKLDEIRKKREKVSQEMEELKKSVEKEKQEKQPF